MPPDPPADGELPAEPSTRVIMGCEMPAPGMQPPIGAWCAGCSTPFDLDGLPLEWDQAWGEPTDYIPAVRDPESVAHEWVDATDDAVGALLRLAELAWLRADRLLELYAVMWLAGWGLRDLADVDTGELMGRAEQLLGRLSEADAQETPAAVLADWYAEAARWNWASNESLGWWRAAVAALPERMSGDPADEIRADALRALHEAGADDEALALAQRFFPSMSESADTSDPAMTAGVAASICEARDRWEEAFYWRLAKAHAELREKDLRELLSSVGVERAASRLTGESRARAAREIERVMARLDRDDERHLRASAELRDIRDQLIQRQ